MRNRVKSLITGFLLFQMIWNMMNAGLAFSQLAFSQMALMDVAMRMMVTFVYALVIICMWGDEA